MSVDVGSVYRASWLVFDASGNPVNPSTASYQVTVGTGTPVSVPVSLPPAQTGVLIADFQTTVPGLHRGGLDDRRARVGRVGLFQRAGVQGAVLTG